MDFPTFVIANRDWNTQCEACTVTNPAALKPYPIDEATTSQNL